MTASQAPLLPILPVILAGGEGARLAPISTPQRPKPFVPLRDGSSLLTRTCERVVEAPFLPPLLVGRAQDRFALLNHARAAGIRPASIFLESAGMNTALALAAAAHAAQQAHGPEIMLAMLPADHWIEPVAAWRAAIQLAAAASAAERRICLLGIPPRKPSREYGYLEVMAEEGLGATYRRVAGFHEKPNEPQALIARGALVNSGQVVAPAGVILAQLAAHAPAHEAAAARAVREARATYEFHELPAPPAGLAALSFDHAVLEHAPLLAVPFSGDWRDLGTAAAWKACTGLDAAHYQALPARVDRPWGYYALMADEPARCEKRLVIYPGCRMSLQRHAKREEQWEVLSGTAYVERAETVLRLEAGERTTIPADTWHRLANHHEQLLIIKEIQIGEPSEYDIERREDDYGRI